MGTQQDDVSSVLAMLSHCGAMMEPLACRYTWAVLAQPVWGYVMLSTSHIGCLVPVARVAVMVVY